MNEHCVFRQIFQKEFLLFLIEALRLEYQKPTDEIIPYYTEKEIDELYNCVIRIYDQGYARTTQERIGTIMYNIVKTHYLSNGNKRMAVIIVKTLAQIDDIEHGKIYDINPDSLKNLVSKIADNTILKKEDAITALSKLIFISTL